MGRFVNPDNSGFQSALNNFSEFTMLDARILAQTGSYDVVVPLINMNFDGLRNDIITMLSGQAVEVDVSSFQNDTVHFENKDDVLTYLIHLGYLGYDQTYQTAFIPNEELRQEMVRATRRRKWDEMISFQKESEALLNATLEMNTDAVAAGISYNKKTKEYQCKIESNHD